MTYSFKNMPLTPTVARKHIIEYLQKMDRPKKRVDIIKYVENEHVKSGGMASNNATGPVKKAIASLLDENLVDNPLNGYYQLKNKVPSENTDPDLAIQEIQEPVEIEEEDAGLINVGKIIGAGPESVYVYYNLSDYELAQQKNNDFWPCKIGMTVGDVTIRILTQGIGTSMYRAPAVGLVIKCEDSRPLEKMIHKVLENANCKIESKFGSEWFHTSPDRIEQLFYDYLKIIDNMGKGIPITNTE
jgi:hypothetical protein